MSVKTEPKDGRTGKKQSFALMAPEAMRVQLVGDFTHWMEQPISLCKSKGGVWRTTLDLSRGTHRYRFLVDGQWRDDPECALRESNPYGGHDAVRQVT